MHFTYESHILHAQFSRAALIVLQDILTGLLSWSTRDKFTILSGLWPALSLLFTGRFPRHKHLLTRQQLTNQTADDCFELLQRRGCSLFSEPVYFRLVLFPFASAVYAFIMFDSGVWKYRAAQKPNLG